MAQTIMVVEDDHDINEVVSEYMKDAGYVVISCVDGPNARDVLSRTPDIDLFILDIMLPGVNGLELLKLIRVAGYHREKPVLMLTALGDEATQILSFDELADDYVVKPFSPKVLVKRVEKLLRSRNGGAKRMQCGSLIIDYDSFEVYDRQEKIPLTFREFELLGTLMTHAGKVLNRQQLLNHAWGYEYFGDERIVDVHIKNLRKKLHSDAIITVKGVGYKLEGGGK
ncbi:MAG: response regulator transcription factor [Lachnospiraceae bacterium]